MRSLLIVILFGVFSMKADDEIKTIQLEPASGLDVAEVSFARIAPEPRAVLILCPGYNGNGRDWLGPSKWREFAERERIDLGGIRFVSPVDLLAQCQGYYQASKGSGDHLLQAIREMYGKELPILLFGFSGGAHFTTRFVAWKPHRVLAWCAIGAGVLDPPKYQEGTPPGIMACGDEDPRLGGALMFFKQGRAVGNRWLWVEMPNTGHAYTPLLEEFSRAYFASILNHKSSDRGAWADIDSKKILSEEEATKTPALSGWLPDELLLTGWQTVQEKPTH